MSSSGVIEREGLTPLPGLSDTIASMQHVVLLLAGSDVTLLHLQIPPLSAARLKAALPNLVEDQLLCDPASCVVAAGSISDGLRTVAVVQRAWLDLLAKTFFSFGAHQIVALPAQSCLSGLPGIVTAAIYEWDSDVDLTLRLSEQDGIGLTINAEPGEKAAHQVIQTLCAVEPSAPITIYVPQAALHAYHEALADTPELKERISFSADNWTRWIAGASSTPLDLMVWRGVRSVSRMWRPWRWPLVLAAAILLINISALNIEWWRIKNEANTLRSALIQIFKSAYPNDSVIIDPLAQMQQKIAAAKRDSGLAAAHDFTAITAAFGEAWTSVIPASTAGNIPAIAALEYHERSLLVKLKPVLSKVEGPVLSRAEGPGSEAPTQQMKAALAQRNLSLELIPAQSAIIWKIRSTQ